MPPQGWYAQSSEQHHRQFTLTDHPDVTCLVLGRRRGSVLLRGAAVHAASLEHGSKCGPFFDRARRVAAQREVVCRAADGLSG